MKLRLACQLLGEFARHMDDVFSCACFVITHYDCTFDHCRRHRVTSSFGGVSLLTWLAFVLRGSQHIAGCDLICADGIRARACSSTNRWMAEERLLQRRSESMSPTMTDRFRSQSFAISLRPLQNASSRLMLVLWPAMTIDRFMTNDFMITSLWSENTDSLPTIGPNEPASFPAECWANFERQSKLFRAAPRLNIAI